MSLRVEDSRQTARHRDGQITARVSRVGRARHDFDESLVGSEACLARRDGECVCWTAGAEVGEDTDDLSASEALSHHDGAGI